MQKEINFLGLPIIKIKKSENYEKRYFLGIQYKCKKYARRHYDFVEAFKDNVPFINNRNIKVILNNLGEAVIYARTAKFWHNKNDLVFGTRLQHADIFKMYAPEIPVFYCGEANLIKPASYNGNYFEAILFDEDLIKINNKGKPFLEAWEKHKGVNFSSLKYKPAIISEETTKCALTKASALGIDINNFVFLMPFARSIELLPKQFWDNVEYELKTKGFDIVYNSKMFSLTEAYVLASKAKAIIALRSGFNDVLCEIKVPQHIIYGHNDWHGDLQPMYSFKDFPWAAKEFITEYNTLKQDINDIKKDILESI
ncbi:MAG: hypothetical protein E7020_00030 [Alphaproteobacteria bacterium]|nr:hypothetical protein [Alphaproteobacteria bacterium]